ncbi:hypothetical protein G6F57_004649 [Rhizopus arrhizus]|uniref:Phospholipid-transporting ATPase n=1 Tax=Rhizopus oryzae TaxID=64495 RepID=A0A9P6XD24_RHIOR|nr:hypothetical protein G6F30_002465 [Rhizopus arrhizus]KAG1423190.1 hypothetical protein G6F58_002929 [Rhizopus delemar]KAG0987215.1 hypothetical protein G6F29_002667 [Rhizopus arrhizus]KAG0994673.1 hypothetical protein G6F28_005524 [Rhizopus arrhizus]KAG1008693.1 hypothetical protein G6F27_006267 [Rhizopus arrhizus]
MPEDYEEGIGLLKQSNQQSSNFIPDYSFSSNANLLNATEATEMLEQVPQASKEAYTDNQHSVGNHEIKKQSVITILKRWINKRRNNLPEGIPRKIYLNQQELNDQQNFMSNSISTAKYNVFTFLPKFLYVEFSKSANIFFLFISGIQQIPNISPTSRYTTLVPLVIVLLITAVKEMIEDFGVHKSDRELNARKCKVFEKSEFIEKPWSQLKVGDICRIDNSQFFPADLILLSSSEPEGLCYIETSNLDGEVNLKIKQALPITAKIVSPSHLSFLEGHIESEQPNNRLYNYDGTLITKDENGTSKSFPLDPNMLLLRGAQLRNTSWIYGVAVFTGHETKLMLNSSKKPTKSSNVARKTNRNILYLFAMLVVMSILCSIGNYVISVKYGDSIDYVGVPLTQIGKEVGYNILTFMILFNSFIPISLMVTMEIVKYIQSTMIDNDLDIYYEKTDTPAVARSSSLIEELGQIEYVFSDKTGTLTCNEMEFRQCSIAGISYANRPDPDKQPTSEFDHSGQYSFAQLEKHLQDAPHKDIINEFLVSLMTCHTVIPETNQETGKIIYQASSPDESALVNGASGLFGYKFVARRPHSIHCVRKEVEEEYQILNVCEFNSTRKRMSVVLRGPDGKIKLYCKGADTVILERLSKDGNPFTAPTLEHLEDYACEGLRTLCFSMREISNEEYTTWSVIYDKAATTLVNRADELDRAAELIEKDMLLLGATAIEDKLQDGVPDTIHTLQEANIKVWVLTGDRQETAINIGYSCKLLMEDMELIICNEEDHVSTKAFLESKLAHIHLLQQTHHDPLAFIIEGKSLGYALEKDVEKTLFEIATQCKAVICCRVSPLQKALVVKLVKRFSKSILLAIGDGANDVSMIQAAHVGVGISGVEGLQAARSADFAISQFRFLKKLLLVHGAWAYQRLSKMIFFYFYKNVAMYLTQFWYAIFNGFSGQTLYESWTMSCFNVIFTILPPMAIGIFDQFASASLLDKHPQMYILGQSMAAFADDSVFTSGHSGGQWWVGTTIFTATLATILWKAALITDIKRMYRPQSYHYIQEIQKFNFPDYRPRMDRFRRAVNKVRKIQRLKQSRGFAFSQNENDQSRLIRLYDTTQQKPSG